MEQTLGEEASHKISKPRTIALCIALACMLISTWLLNSTAYPGFNDFFPEARDIATTFGALAAALLAFLSLYRPHIFCRTWFLIASLAVMLLGEAVMFASVDPQSAALATLGACLRSIGTFAGSIYLVLNLATFTKRGCLIVLAVSYILKYVLMGALWYVPDVVQAIALMALPTLAAIIFFVFARPSLAHVATSEAPADSAITNPLSFLPFTHRMFVAILMFAMALGFAITYGSVDGQPLPFIYASVIVIVVAIVILIRHHISSDILYGVAFILVLAGLVLVPNSFGDSSQLNVVANTLLQGGSDVFELVIWFMLASITARNLSAGIPALLMRCAAMNIGTEIGALLGHMANSFGSGSPSVVVVVVCAIAVIFAGYNFFLIRRFSFDRTIEGIEPIVRPLTSTYTEEHPSIEHDDRASIVDSVCEQMSATYGLTARESQVLSLLARGRNVAYIQEDLVLSRNTIKSYVASVYAKLNVHSHQQVIDMVEQAVSEKSTCA